MMPTSQRRKRITVALGLILMTGLAWMLWPFIAGPNQMKNFCNSLPAGSSRAQVEAQAAQHNYRVSSLGEDQTYIHDPKSFGRFICDIRFGSEGLVSATYSFND